jgi:protein-disulfide isomerase
MKTTNYDKVTRHALNTLKLMLTLHNADEGLDIVQLAPKTREQLVAAIQAMEAYGDAPQGNALQRLRERGDALVKEKAEINARFEKNAPRDAGALSAWASALRTVDAKLTEVAAAINAITDLGQV